MLQVYHKGNKIVINALVPEDTDAHDLQVSPGDRNLHGAASLRTRGQQRGSDQEVQPDISIDGSQIYASSLQEQNPAGVAGRMIAGKCRTCFATQSTGWYDDEQQRPLSLCAGCHYATHRRKRHRAEGGTTCGVTFWSSGEHDGAAGKRSGVGGKSPKRPRVSESVCASSDEEGKGDEGRTGDDGEGSESEEVYGHMMMSQAFGDHHVPDDEDDEEFGPSDDEDRERTGGIFAGHHFLVTNVESDLKKKLRTQIEAQGGHIVTVDSMEAGKEPSKLAVLTTAPCQTPNFLCGLAVGVCILSTEWVAECLRQKQLAAIHSYRLVAGFDEDNQKRIKVLLSMLHLQFGLEKMQTQHKRRQNCCQ